MKLRSLFLSEGFDIVALGPKFLTGEEIGLLAGIIMARESHRKADADPWDDQAYQGENHPEYVAYKATTKLGRFDFRKGITLGTTVTVDQLKQLVNVCMWYSSKTSGPYSEKAGKLAAKFLSVLKGHDEERQ